MFKYYIFLFCLFATVNAWSYKCNNCNSNANIKPATEDTCKELGGKWNGSSCYNLTKFQACTVAAGHCATWGCGAKCF
ncbi:hypothetical protein BCR42DRAFT_403819 [Absidia repens]|uniref:Uncharacterized protein n=1 Tax=Absidia repens TaxID=90262 RepID=A0A1X2IVK4_9FUNG|nr:hypothetical protein BCR42DRAFT_403819 [Absidia repens]